MTEFAQNTLELAQSLTDLHVEITYSDHDAHVTLAVGNHCTLDCYDGKPIEFTIDGFENVRWHYADMATALKVSALGEAVIKQCNSVAVKL